MDTRDVPGSQRGYRDQRGASLVEFALVLPLFALLLLGMIDFGLLFGGFTSLRGGVEAGARLASVDDYATGDTCSASDATSEMVCAIAARVGKNLIGTTNSGIEVGINFYDTTGTSESTAQIGDSVVVCERVNMKSTTGFTAWMLNGRSMTSQSELRLEQAPSYATFSLSSQSVTYGGVAITGITCPTGG